MRYFGEWTNYCIMRIFFDKIYYKRQDFKYLLLKK
jgi:hypothetical protein